jgi:hypothetical protein
MVVDRGEDPLAAAEVRRTGENEAEVARCAVESAGRVMCGVGKSLDCVEAL